ncbi:hypothetical protein N7G274_002719 [Stereocaulon virgatum]|uniref:Major facilitator superfamily (MFS) profile domain-containing protein n=1 Tax=Stereocaulon virgatum TaxID=373712 RepID=A0ABR4AJS2_9LECA
MGSKEVFALFEFDHTISSGYSGEQPSIHRRPSRQAEHEQEHAPLPRADGGRDAWLFLLGSFFIEALIWGFPYSFGLFQEYYTTHAPFSNEPSGIAVIGTLALGIMYLGAPFTFALLQRFPHHRRRFAFAGLVITSTALIGSSFATRVWHLILTQGVLYAVGGSILYFPTIIFLDEWFIRRKGLAYGVMWAGTGVSGVCIPFIMNWGLSRYSFSTMLRVWSIVLILLAGPLLLFVKPRTPVSPTSCRRPISLAFIKTSTFWALQTGNILQGLGFFMPNIYLPSYARAIGLSSIAGTVTITLFNTMSVFGQVIQGALSDKLHVTTVILMSTIGATLSVFLLWGLSASLPLLCIFSIMYGLSAGGFSSTWTGATQEIRKRDDNAELGMVFGLLAAGRGIGSVVSGPLSEALLSDQPWRGEATLGYGTGYGPLIVFTGITAMCGGFSWVGRRAGWV